MSRIAAVPSAEEKESADRAALARPFVLLSLLAGLLLP
jgi:hypothetical protein